MTAGMNYLITTYFQWQQNHELRLDELSSSLVQNTNTPTKVTESDPFPSVAGSYVEDKGSECTNRL